MSTGSGGFRDGSDFDDYLDMVDRWEQPDDDFEGNGWAEFLAKSLHIPRDTKVIYALKGMEPYLLKPALRRYKDVGEPVPIFIFITWQQYFEIPREDRPYLMTHPEFERAEYDDDFDTPVSSLKPSVDEVLELEGKLSRLELPPKHVEETLRKVHGDDVVDQVIAERARIAELDAAPFKKELIKIVTPTEYQMHNDFMPRNPDDATKHHFDDRIIEMASPEDGYAVRTTGRVARHAMKACIMMLGRHAAKLPIAERADFLRRNPLTNVAWKAYVKNRYKGRFDYEVTFLDIRELQWFLDFMDNDEVLDYFERNR